MPVTSVSYFAEGWGVGEVWFDGERLVWHELPRPRSETPARPETHRGTRARTRVTPSQKGGGKRPPPTRSTIAAKSAPARRENASEVQDLVDRLEEYFSGKRVSFADVELDLDGWTPFQLDVVKALRQVPYGEVVSYRDLARLAGHPRAQRAAGTFCARNRFALVVPCHRVVASDGLGSYGSLGIAYKQRLLALEGVSL